MSCTKLLRSHELITKQAKSDNIQKPEDPLLRPNLVSSYLTSGKGMLLSQSRPLAKAWVFGGGGGRIGRGALRSTVPVVVVPDPEFSATLNSDVSVRDPNWYDSTVEAFLVSVPWCRWLRRTMKQLLYLSE